MCEFCVEHGEGKKWYLLMKNYSDELVHAELSDSQKDEVRATTRAEPLRAAGVPWLHRLSNIRAP